MKLAKFVKLVRFVYQNIDEILALVDRFRDVFKQQRTPFDPKDLKPNDLA